MPSVIPPMEPMPAARTGPVPRPPRPGDVGVTVLALVLLAPAALYAAWHGVEVMMAHCDSVDGCGGPRFEAGFLLAAVPLACWLLAVVVSVMLMLTRRRALWVPLAAVVVWLVASLAVIGVQG